MSEERAIELGKALTPRQKRFADLVLRGVSKKNAYKEAGYSTGRTSRNATAMATQTLSKEKVKAYMDAVRSSVTRKSVADLQEIAEILTEVARAKTIETKTSDKVKACTELKRLLGERREGDEAGLAEEARDAVDSKLRDFLRQKGIKE